MKESFARTLRTLRYLRPEQVAWRLWYRAQRPFLSSSLYSRMLGEAGRGVPPPRGFPSWVWPGDVENGRRILSGRIVILNREIDFPERPAWADGTRTALERFTLNYFEWLADLKPLQGREPANRARALLMDWWRVHQARMGAEAWHPYPTSLRLYSWLAHGEWLMEGADQGFKVFLVQALDRHVRHLARMIERDVAGNHIIKNYKALIVAAVCLPAHAPRLATALTGLRREVSRQVLPDGCHYELSPSYHQQVLMDLVDLRGILKTETPAWLDNAITNMGDVFAFFRHGDGLLAQFNDGEEGKRAIVDALDGHLLQPVPPTNLPSAGYHRVAADGVLVLFDAGLCCPDDLPAHAHADAMSFEMSDGTDRIIVNSGTYAYQDAYWRNRLRGTAAHSTLTIDDMDSAEIYGVFRLGRRPRKVESIRSGNEVTASHDGWRHLGVCHHRTIRLGVDGLAGEDIIKGAAGRSAIVRFHLHPGLEVCRQGETVVMTLPSGRKWRCDAAGADLTLEPGHYSPTFGVLKPNLHIKVTAAIPFDEPFHIRWCFSALSS